MTTSCALSSPLQGLSGLDFRSTFLIPSSGFPTASSVSTTSKILIRRTSPRCQDSVATRSATSERNRVATAPKRGKDPKKRVVITGMGLVSVFGNHVDTFYDKLLAGESGIAVIDRFDASGFPTTFAGQIRGFDSEGYISAKQERRLEDCLKYCLVSGQKALESARLGSEELRKLDKLRVGALVGSGIGAQMTFIDGVQKMMDQRKLSPFFIPYTNVSAASALLAIELGLMGPNYSISTACATSNYCFYAAANHIRKGEADVIIAGGTESPITPVSVGGFTACRFVLVLLSIAASKEKN